MIYRYCGNYIDHSTVFRIPAQNPEVVFRCSSRNADQPFSATYSSYNTSQRKNNTEEMRNNFKTVIFHQTFSLTRKRIIYVTKMTHVNVLTLVLFVFFQACPEGHFLCSTGLCVEKFRRCDGLDDCQDESDEIFCCTLTTKSCNPSSSAIVKQIICVNI